MVYLRLGRACAKIKTAKELAGKRRKKKQGVGRGGTAEGFSSMMEDGRRQQDTAGDQPEKMQGEGEGSISDRAWSRPTRA